MAWLSDGAPVHRCLLPPVRESSSGLPDDGFYAGDDSTARHVHAGARWQCDHCGRVYVLTEDGEWQPEWSG